MNSKEIKNYLESLITHLKPDQIDNIDTFSREDVEHILVCLGSVLTVQRVLEDELFWETVDYLEEQDNPTKLHLQALVDKNK